MRADESTGRLLGRTFEYWPGMLAQAGRGGEGMNSRLRSLARLLFNEGATQPTLQGLTVLCTVVFRTLGLIWGP
jgi:hypothetical protein